METKILNNKNFISFCNKFIWSYFFLFLMYLHTNLNKHFPRKYSCNKKLFICKVYFSLRKKIVIFFSSFHFFFIFIHSFIHFFIILHSFIFSSSSFLFIFFPHHFKFWKHKISIFSFVCVIFQINVIYLSFLW